MKLEFYFDDELRHRPCAPQALREHVSLLIGQLEASSDSESRVRMMGELGHYLETLDELSEAERYLLSALDLIKSESLSQRLELQQQIRLAKVYQHQKRFEESDLLYAELIRKCGSSEQGSYFLPFALQHAGKSLFDQRRFSEALEHFEKALKIRLAMQAPEDQIESTKLAIEATKNRAAQT